MSKEVIVGTDGVGSGMHIFPTALNSILGTKFKIIDGYKDTGDVILAIDRGEVHGLCLSAETLTNMRGDSFKSGEWRPILQTGLTASPDFPDVPLIFDRAKTTEQKQILSFLFASQAFGRPYLAPPGLPPERLAMLRKAFDETMRDPKFLADVAKARLKVSPITGAEMDRMIDGVEAHPEGCRGGRRQADRKRRRELANPVACRSPALERTRRKVFKPPRLPRRAGRSS